MLDLSGLTFIDSTGLRIVLDFNERCERLRVIAQPHATVADKIRALSAAGVARADIARFLGKRYQHVRNVLEDDAQSSGGYVLGKADLSGVQEGARAFAKAREQGGAHVSTSPGELRVSAGVALAHPLDPALGVDEGAHRCQRREVHLHHGAALRFAQL